MIRTLCIAALVSAALPGRAESKGPFEVKSGVLEDTTTIAGSETSEVLYFDDFGQKQAKYSTVSIDLGGQKMVTHSLKIDLADGTTYNVDLDQKTGTKMKMPPEAAKLMGMAMSEEFKKDMKVTNLPEREFLGKRCKGVQVEAKGFPPTKAWTWKGLTLYSEAGGGGGAPIIIKATKLSVDVPVLAEKFKVPAGVKIEDAGG